jgi:hypothetical protein
MFKVEFVHWVRKASIWGREGERGEERRGEERRGSSHHKRELGNRT